MKPSATPSQVSRRHALQQAGAVTAAVVAGASLAPRTHAAAAADDLTTRIAQTPFIDTHEHLVEEVRRTDWKPHRLLPCNDWALLFSHYLDSDLRVAGMTEVDYQRFFSPDTPADRKWALLEPYWPAVRHTGYGQAVRITLEKLYGVSELSAQTLPRLIERYSETVRPGFYETVLRQHAGIESCQVNSLEHTFAESAHPLLLMQDLSIIAFGAHGGRGWTWMTDSSGRKATDLAGYHRVIDHWFARYGPFAVATKSQVAYQRRLDFEDVPAERAEEPFRKLLENQPLNETELKAVDDHIFWYCVRKSTAYQLPVKLHTGYYAGQGGMPLSRVAQNPADVADLLRRAPDTTFVLMHIGYPYQDAMISLAKHYPNAVIDMCWAWIINPAASERFLREFLVTAPANKLLAFGGDYIPVEPVVGHAAIARRGIRQALDTLQREGWISAAEALDLVQPLMNGNARRIFRLKEKAAQLRTAPWFKAP